MPEHMVQARHLVCGSSNNYYNDLDLSVFMPNMLRLYAPTERHKLEDIYAMIAPVGIAWQAVQYCSTQALWLGVIIVTFLLQQPAQHLLAL